LYIRLKALTWTLYLYLISHNRPKWIRESTHTVIYFINFLRGARIAKTATKTSGHWSQFNNNNMLDTIEFGGACPIQGSGTINNCEAYYRSRGTGWELEIAKPGNKIDDGNDSWVYYSGRKYHFPDGGWLDPEVTKKNISVAVNKYYNSLVI